MSALVPPQDCWVDERLVVGESPIEGRGLFVAEPVSCGTVVIRLGGRLASSAELDARIAAAKTDSSAPFVDTITIFENVHLVLPPATPVHFGNHSCDPNLWHVGPFEVAARRDLKAGEEATIDYGTQSGIDAWAMTCRCRSERCRTRVSSDDWRVRDLQERYAGHWVPALQERIHERS